MYPEGLALQLHPTFRCPAIYDAQDICWIEFSDGGYGDPTTWQGNIIRDTCAALGIEQAFDEDGNERSIIEFLENYVGGLDFYE